MDTGAVSFYARCGILARRYIQDARVEALCIEEMHSRDEVWRDWLTQDNPYAARDRRSMEAGAGKYLNFIKMILRKA